jgi:hypothetical protein
MKKIFGISISIMISVNIISTTAFGFAVNVYDDNTVTTQNISRKNKIDYQYRNINGILYKRLYDLTRISP